MIGRFASPAGRVTSTHVRPYFPGTVTTSWTGSAAWAAAGAKAEARAPRTLTAARIGQRFGSVIVPDGAAVAFRRQGWLRSVSQAGRGFSARPPARYPRAMADGCRASA